MLKVINQKLFETMLETAEESERKRSHHNFHDDLTDSVQRLCVALKQGTYIRPHKHPEPKWEMFIVLSGRVLLHIYNDNGAISETVELSANGEVSAIEIAAGVWHSLMALTADAVIMEFKPGPYLAAAPEDFAFWAPAEGDAAVSDFLSWAEHATKGEIYHSG